MNRKQLQYPLSLNKTQRGDVVVNIVVVLGVAIVAFFLWQYFQDTNNEDDLQLRGQTTQVDESLSNNAGAVDNQVDPLQRQQETLRLAKETMQSSDDQSNDLDPSDQDIIDHNLPALENSDELTRQSLADLSATPIWRKWLKTAQPIRKFTQFIENIARGKVPHKYFRFMAPLGQFKVGSASDDQYFLDPAGYKRYDSIARCIDSLDAENLVSVYTKLEPLIESAWGEIKTNVNKAEEPNHSFDQIFLSAIKRIRSAPAINKQIRLIRPSVMYKYADPKLERLSAVSKQMLRMGPKNTRIIQKKLDEIEELFQERHHAPSDSDTVTD